MAGCLALLFMRGAKVSRSACMWGLCLSLVQGCEAHRSFDDWEREQVRLLQDEKRAVAVIEKLGQSGTVRSISALLEICCPQGFESPRESCVYFVDERYNPALEAIRAIIRRFPEPGMEVIPVMSGLYQ